MEAGYSMSSIIEAMLSPDVEKTVGFNEIIRVKNECQKCTSGWEYLAETGKCYGVIRTKVTWDMARISCQKVITNGDLVSIPNDEVNQFLLDTLVKTGEDYWTGQRS